MGEFTIKIRRTYKIHEIEQYDLTYENDSCIKTPPKKIKTPICSSCQQIDERISYEQFSSNMKKLNHEQRIIVDIYIYIYQSSKPLHIFLIGGVGVKKTFTFICIMQNMLQYYVRQMLTFTNSKL
jgi:hypothetical protein